MCSYIQALWKQYLIFWSADLTVGFPKMELLGNHKYALKIQANIFKQNTQILTWI